MSSHGSKKKIGSHDGQYDSVVLLRARHASADLSPLESILGVKADGGYQKGQPRVSFTGRPISGVYDESFWQARCETSENDFKNGVARFVNVVKDSQPKWHAIFGPGLRWEMYVQHIGLRNHRGTYEPDLLSRMAQIPMALGVEVFPEWNFRPKK
jgi:hypothetical protein